MRGNITGCLTSYLLGLTAKFQHFTHLVKSEKIDEIQQITQNPEQYVKQNYKKREEWNYLQYFNHILSLDPLPIKLLKPTQPFSLKQDIIILATVSNNPNQITFKVLEELAKNRRFYGANFKNQLIKRPFKRLVERYKYLENNIGENEILHIISYIERKGLDQNSFISLNSHDQYLKTNLKIGIGKTTLEEKPNKPVRSYVSHVKANRMEPVCDNFKKSFESEIDREIKQSFQSFNQQADKKKTAQSQVLDMNIIFATPDKKIEMKIPNAPKKQKAQESDSEVEEKKTRKIIKIEKQRRFVRVIDAKKDVIIKEDSSEWQDSQKVKYSFQIKDEKTEEQKLKSSPNHKNYEHQVSEFKLFSDQEPQAQKQERIVQQGQIPKEILQESLRLKIIADDFAKKTNLNQVEILKLLADVSGDLQDLQLYLKTKDENLLWQPLTDAALIKYCQSRGKTNKKRVGKSLNVETLYESIVKAKGENRVQKRLAYLGLKI